MFLLTTYKKEKEDVDCHAVRDGGHKKQQETQDIECGVKLRDVELRDVELRCRTRRDIEKEVKWDAEHYLRESTLERC